MADAYTPAQMAAAIRRIAATGGGITTTPLSVTENGTYTAPVGTAYTPVTVDVTPELQSKEVTVTENGSTSVQPDSGYDGLSGVTVVTNVPTDTADATAVAADILSGKTAYAGGAKITGTMTNRGTVSGTISTKAQVYTIAQGYHSGSGTVKISTTEQNKIVAGNIKNGVTILGVTGTYGSSGVLPSGYTQLAYIESSGTQYINTGLSLSSGYRIVAKVMFITGNPSNALFFGAENVSGGAKRLLTGLWMGGWSLGAGSVWAYNLVTANKNQLYNIESAMLPNYFLKVDGTSLVSGTDSGTDTRPNRQAYLFALNSDETPKFYGVMRIYDSFSIYNASGTLISKLWPAKRNSDQVIGMYDTVRITFYTNSGSGVFVAGPEV